MPQRDNLIAKVWQRVRPTVSKGEKKFENKSFNWRPTVSMGDKQFQLETNSFNGRPTVLKGEQKSM